MLRPGSSGEAVRDLQQRLGALGFTVPPEEAGRFDGGTLAEIADEQRGKIAIAKLNVDDNPDTARRFDVMSIPTLIVFRDGEPAKRMIGAKGKGQLLQELSEFL